MGRIGFWDLLDDKLDVAETTYGINTAHDKAEAAARLSESVDQRVDELLRRVDRLTREVTVLRAALGVLARTLKDTDVLDDRLLDARMEAAIEEALAPPEPVARSLPPVVCTRCGRQVPAASTTITAGGPVCDRCP